MTNKEQTKTSVRQQMSTTINKHQQVAPDEKTRDAWVAAINHCINLMKSLCGKTVYEQWVAIIIFILLIIVVILMKSYWKNSLWAVSCHHLPPPHHHHCQLDEESLWKKRLRTVSRHHHLPPPHHHCHCHLDEELLGKDRLRWVSRHHHAWFTDYMVFNQLFCKLLYKRFLKKKFRIADKNGSGTLTYKETKALVKVGWISYLFGTTW